MTFSGLRVALLFVAVAATACLMPAQADSYWHLRAGQDFFRTWQVPLLETYSHTAPGLPWPNHEWLWQALSYGLYSLGGMPLLAAGAAACATVACALAYRLMGARPEINFLLALIGIPLASLVWAVRPQVASLLLLTVLVHLLVSWRLWAIPPLFVLWANLHGAVALGGAVLVVGTVVAWFDDRRRFYKLLAVTLVSGLLTAATPMGTQLWRFIGESMARSRRNQIMEWLPSYPNGPIEIAFWVGAVALVVIAWKRWRRLNSWSDRLVVAVALMLLPLAARAVRNISPFFLLWMPAISRLIGPEARLPHRRVAATTPNADQEHPRVNIAMAVLAGVGAAIAVGVCWALPLARLGWQPISPGAAAAVEACPGPLYNRYNEGGILIWFTPRVPVFIDSRQDPYPAALLTAHAEVEQSGDHQALFTEYGIKCAALPPRSLVGGRLRGDGWVEKYADPEWVVLHAPRAR